MIKAFRQLFNQFRAITGRDPVRAYVSAMVYRALTGEMQELFTLVKVMDAPMETSLFGVQIIEDIGTVDMEIKIK